MNEETAALDAAALRQAAETTHAMFAAYVQAGFSEDQAMKLLIGILGTVNPVNQNQMQAPWNGSRR